MECAVVDVSQRDVSVGFSCVMISPVTTLHGIMFDAGFDLSDIRTNTRLGADPRAADRIRREGQILLPPMIDNVL